jgi:hypothetical protein
MTEYEKMKAMYEGGVPLSEIVASIDVQQLRMDGDYATHGLVNLYLKASNDLESMFQ